MNYRIIAWTALAGLLACGPARAQQLESKEALFFVSFVDSGTVKAEDQQRQHRMYEDIEIMRRLLDRTLRSVPGAASTQGAGVAYGDFDGDGLLDLFILNQGEGMVVPNRPRAGIFEHATASRATDKWHHDHDNVPHAEGVYLPNQGVIYSATLPIHFLEPVKKAADPVRKPLTDWERTRKELAGEKVDQEKRTAPPSDVSLADRVLKLLFDNGRHFSQLDGKENLTVALTLRAESQCTVCHDHPWKTSAAQPATERGLQWLKSQQSSGAAKADPSQSSTAAGLAALAAAGAARQDQKERNDAIAKAREESHRQALLGDLHMKQGQPADAVEAYRKADQLHTEAARVQSLQGVKHDLKTHLEALELGTKLAQALLAAGRGEEAKKLLEAQLVASALKAAMKEADPKAEAAPKIDLPSKLIVSAPKTLLDQAGAGKITFDEFKKSASVQYVAFPTAKNEPPPTAAPPPGGKKGN
jgi:hypothetical protein